MIAEPVRRLGCAVLTAGALLALLPGVAAAATTTSIDGPSADIDANQRIDVDVAPDGTGALVYLRKVAGVERVFAARLAGGAWGGPVQVDDPANLNASSFPSVAVAPGGKTVVLFTRAKQIYASTATGGGAFSVPAPVALDPAWKQTGIDLGDNGDGYAWALTDSGNNDLYAFRLQGTTWTQIGATFPNGKLDVGLETAGDGDQREPRIATKRDGSNATIVWSDGDPPNSIIHARRLTPASLGTAVPASLTDLAGAPADGTANDMADVAPAAGDTAWVAFRQSFTYSATGRARSLARLFDGSAFGPVQVIDGLGSAPTEGSEYPRITANPSGEGIAVLYRQLTNNAEASALAGGTWGAALPITTTATATSRSTAALADSGSGLIATRLEPAPGDSSVVGRVRAAGVLGAPEPLSNPAFGPAGAPRESGAGADVAATAFVQGAAATVRIVAASVPLPPRPTPQGPGGGGPPPGDTTAPRISALRISPSTFRRGTGAPRISATATGTRVRFTLTEAASVALSVERRTSGRRVRGRCVRATRGNRRSARCTRYVKRTGTARLAGRAGANTVRFSGRLSARLALAPGRYRLIVGASDPAGNRSTPARASFTLLAPARRR